MNRSVPVVLAVTLAGCFHYTAVPRDEIDPGTELRIDLSEAGQARLRALTGRSLTSVEGTLVRREPEAFVISAPLPVGRGAVPNRALVERLQIEIGDIGSMRVKELDRVRSSVLALAFVAATVAVIGRVFEDDPGGVVPYPEPPGPGEGLDVWRGWWWILSRD